MKPPKSDAGKRDIKLSRSAVAASRRTIAREKLRGTWQPDGFVFCTDRGTPLHHSNVLRRSFYPACERARIPYGELRDGLVFHGLRHSAATLTLASADPSITTLVVSKMLGHRKPHYTEQLYGHILPRQKQAIADYMDRAVGS